MGVKGGDRRLWVGKHRELGVVVYDPHRSETSPPAVLLFIHDKGAFESFNRLLINDNYSCRRIASPDLLPGEHRCLKIPATEGRHGVDDESGGTAGAGGGVTERCQRSTPAERGRILDEFVVLTGYHRNTPSES